MYPRPVQNLIEAFEKLPGVGPKQATRCVFYLARNPDEIPRFLSLLRELNESTSRCKLCFAAFEKVGGKGPDLCKICRDPRRDHRKICIVTSDIDLWAIEDTHLYNGMYAVLGDVISFAETKEEPKARLNALLTSLKEGVLAPQEIIVATNHDLEGDTTFFSIKRSLGKFPDIKITRLGRGLPTGGELAYADEETLRGAFEGRK